MATPLAIGGDDPLKAGLGVLRGVDRRFYAGLRGRGLDDLPGPLAPHRL